MTSCIRTKVGKGTITHILDRSRSHYTTVYATHMVNWSRGVMPVSTVDSSTVRTPTLLTVYGKVKLRLLLSQHRPLTADAMYGCGAHLRFLVLSQQ